MDRPQVRTVDGFVLRRTGYYNIYEIALAGVIDRQNRQSLILRERIIRITVQPPFTRLRGCDDRMSAGMRVLACMPVWRAVAAKCRAARLTSAQMHPIRADLDALFAFTALRVFDRVDRVKMRATSIGHSVILAEPDERKQLLSILRRQPRRLA